MFDMMNIMGKVKGVQAKVKEVQAELENKTVEGEAAAGMVKATANGHRKIIKLEIDPSFVDPNDTQMLADLICAAVNNANEKAETMAKEAVQKETAGMMPNIPGLDLSNFGM